MVGEEGPEIFSPSGHGDIMPASLARGARGGNTTVNMFIKANDPAAFRASRGQVVADMKRAARMK